MKVENGVSHFFESARTSPQAGKSANPSNAFAAILGEKLQAAAGNTASASPVATHDAKQYDFTHMSRNELLETVNGLIRSGDLTLDETSPLLGMMGSSPLLKVNYDGKPLENGDAPTNVFARIQEGIEGARSRNETASVARLERAAEALMKFQEPGITVRA